MKPPKNFYSNLDRRKQGLPELPEASAADVGKIVKVGEDGDYELGEDAGLPPYTDDDIGSLIQLKNEGYALYNPSSRAILALSSSKNLRSIYSIGIYINIGSTNTFQLSGESITIGSLYSFASSNPYNIRIFDSGNIYYGFIISSTISTLKGIIYKDNIMQLAEITSNSVSYKPIGSTIYYEIETSGSSVSLPSGVTFADVYALLQAGVDVKFTSGARVYSVTSFESTNIRAHWMTDLDLTNMEVYVINLASDGTGTVASATFSGS